MSSMSLGKSNHIFDSLRGHKSVDMGDTHSEKHAPTFYLIRTFRTDVYKAEHPGQDYLGK